MEISSGVVTPVKPLSGILGIVPNAPKTPIRGFRVPDDVYKAAQAQAEELGIPLSDVVRAALEKFAKTGKAPRR